MFEQWSGRFGPNSKKLSAAQTRGYLAIAASWLVTLFTLVFVPKSAIAYVLGGGVAAYTAACVAMHHWIRLEQEQQRAARLIERSERAGRPAAPPEG